MQYSVPTIIINSKKIIIYRNLTWISTLTFTLIQLLWMDSCMEISTKISAATNARQSFQNSSGTMRKIFPWPTHRLTEMRSRQEPAEGNYCNKNSSVFYCSIVWFTCFFVVWQSTHHYLIVLGTDLVTWWIYKLSTWKLEIS